MTYGISSHADGVTIELAVRPGSARSGVIYRNGRLLVRISSPPVDGRANIELFKALKKILGVPPSRMAILSGEHGRTKKVLVEGVAVGEALRSIEYHLAQE